VLPSIIKFNICGDILVTRIFEEFWYFTTRENGAILGVISEFWLAGGIGPRHCGNIESCKQRPISFSSFFHNLINNTC